YRLGSIKDYTKKIPAIRFIVTTLEEFCYNLPEFYIGDTTTALFTLNSKQDLYRAEVTKIINAHYGVVQYNGFNDENCVIFVIPLKVHDIRPKNMDVEKNQSYYLQEITNDPFNTKKIETQLIRDIKKKNPNIDLKKNKKTIELIKRYHFKQKRKSGEPFYLHPIMVTEILLQFTSDEDTLIASLLHDIVEDTQISLLTIEVMFNPEVAKLVDGVTKLDLVGKKINLSKHENIQKLIEQEDQRVLMIKIADRTHNMRTITNLSYEKQQNISEQTLQFYIPMAKALNLPNIVITELQHLVFEILNKKSNN
ncbi:MAG: HD domain-containing protein, partial [Gammaproteobacteria bacterium]